MLMPTPTDPREAAWLRCRDAHKALPSPTGLGARWFFEAGWDAREAEADAQSWVAQVRSAAECEGCVRLEVERDRLAGQSASWEATARAQEAEVNKWIGLYDEALLAGAHLAERVRRLEYVLRSVEWVGSYDDEGRFAGNFCPVCRCGECSHSTGCALGAALADADAPSSDETLEFPARAPIRSAGVQLSARTSPPLEIHDADAPPPTPDKDRPFEETGPADDLYDLDPPAGAGDGR
jgi:hypothetical protein